MENNYFSIGIHFNHSLITYFCVRVTVFYFCIYSIKSLTYVFCISKQTIRNSFREQSRRNKIGENEASFYI